MIITAIHGQNHRGSTWHIADLLIRALGYGNEVNEFFLPQDMPHFCIGCMNCITKGEETCPHREEMESILQVMDRADLLIFTTPTYAYHASGSMMALLDHLAWRWMAHRPESSAFKKQAVVLSTSSGSTTRHALRDIAHSLEHWGIGKIYRYGVAVRAPVWEKIKSSKREEIDRAVAKLAQAIQKNAGHVRPALCQRLRFRIVALRQRSPKNDLDGRYWREKSWTDGVKPWDLPKNAEKR